MTTDKPLIIDSTPEIAPDWRISHDGCVMVLLTCEHYYGPISEASSDFDFPDEPHHCSECNTDRQFHIDVQAALYDNEEI